MIVSKDTNPEKDLYYLGAQVLEVLSFTETVEVNYVEIFLILKAKMQISNNLYALSLDWLFLLGAIDISAEGNIRKCF